MNITYITGSTPLMVGDIAPPFVGLDTNKKNFILWGHAGTPVVVFFWPKISVSWSHQLLVHFAKLHEAFSRAGAIVVGVGLENEEVTNQVTSLCNLPYPMLSVDSLKGQDKEKIQILTQYGVIQTNQQQPNMVDFSPMTFLIDENSRIKKIYKIADAAIHPQEVLSDVQRLLPARESQAVTMQAPVLLIDNVLSKEECDYLMRAWEMQGNAESGSMLTIDGKTKAVYDYNMKIRRDHVISEPAFITHLDVTLRRRVFPQIKKAFHFDCTRREEYKVACYDGDRGGYFRRHRDNATPATAHRVWAMSLNLNSDQYDGGYLKFPEFSGYRYKPKTGSALIFSGGLMHEATDVSNGRRFVLLQFLYGEKEAEIREKNIHLLADRLVAE